MLWLILGVAAALLASARPGFADAPSTARSVTIMDSIGSTEVGQELADVADPYNHAPAVFSPSRARFVVVTHRGNLKKNTNDYILLLFDANEALTNPHGRLVATFAASTNNPGISQLHWLGDNKTVLFIGSRLDSPAQIYAVNVDSGRSRQLTHLATDVTEFDATVDMHTIVFKAKDPVATQFGEAVARRGIVVSGESLGDLIAGQPPDDSDETGSVYIARAGQVLRKVTLPPTMRVHRLSGISLSPDGAYAILNTVVRDPSKPLDWIYRDRVAGRALIKTFAVVDTRSATGRLLINGPVEGGVLRREIVTTAVWAADSKSFIVDAYLPPEIAGANETPLNFELPSVVEARSETPSLVEMNIVTGSWVQVAAGRCQIDRWSASSSTLYLEPYISSSSPGLRTCDGAAVYRKVNNGWVSVPDAKVADDRPAINVELVEDLNNPPQLFAIDPKSGRRSLLLDLNPQYGALRFGNVREIEIQGQGETLKGGLYYPVGYTSGRRYPLVIQTHGWEPHRFAIDGESSAGFAAQTLAGEGFMVVQMDVPHTTQATPKEGESAMVAYQNLIDMLNVQGLVDPDRVGLQTWSRTGLTARYTAAFSNYPIAASIIVDSFDPAYFSYMALATISSEKGNPTTEAINGGPPFGEHLQQWLQRVPEFNLQRVETPILQFSFERDEPLGMWEFFAGLKLLHKPIEYIHLPSSHHWPVRPSDRIAVQQRSVDWFRFWLQGHERAEPITEAQETPQDLVDQYARWEKLCDLRMAEDRDHPAFCVGSKH